MMPCPHCGKPTRVLDTRTSWHRKTVFVRRRRECLRCKCRFSTVETAAVRLNVGGLGQPFDLAARARFAVWLKNAAKRILQGDLNI